MISDSKGLIRICNIIMLIVITAILFKNGSFHTLYYKIQPSYLNNYNKEEQVIEVIKQEALVNTEKPVYIVPFSRTDNGSGYTNNTKYTLKYVLLDERKVGVLVKQPDLKYFREGTKLKVIQNEGIMTLSYK